MPDIMKQIEARVARRSAEAATAFESISNAMVNGNFETAEKTFIAIEGVAKRTAMLSRLRETLTPGDFYLFASGVISRMGKLIDIHVIGRDG